MAAARRRPLSHSLRLDKHFAELDEPFVYEHPPGMSRRDAMLAAAVPHHQHRDRMIRLLRELADVPLTGPEHALSARHWQSIAEQLVKYFVPAFGPPVLAPAKRPPGRPASGLTARQKAAIGAAVAAGRSVREACRRLARGDAKKAEALAAAWRRATKPGVRRN